MITAWAPQTWTTLTNWVPSCSRPNHRLLPPLASNASTIVVDTSDQEWCADDHGLQPQMDVKPSLSEPTTLSVLFCPHVKVVTNQFIECVVELFICAQWHRRLRQYQIHSYATPVMNYTAGQSRLNNTDQTTQRCDVFPQKYIEVSLVWYLLPLSFVQELRFYVCPQFKLPMRLIPVRSCIGVAHLTHQR